MSLLVQQRCLNHAQREAAARCPRCRRFYCRECVTDHDDQVICAACLKNLTLRKGGKGAGLLRACGRWSAALAGCCLLFWLFYATSRLILSVPDTFHEGVFWKKPSPNKNRE
ncbi:MAG: rhomboid family protein [Verrucomicrobiae bacterium]|nr:rhomboid family protein [Verrucomicrobiae bacterium]